MLFICQKWYPVIDYEICKECRACFNKCKHRVYEKEGNRPLVVFPEGCVQGCKGCQSLCPSGAIQYVGDNGQTSDCTCLVAVIVKYILEKRTRLINFRSVRLFFYMLNSVIMF